MIKTPSFQIMRAKALNDVMLTDSWHCTEDCFCGRRSIVMCFAFMGYVWSIKYNAQLKSYFHIFIPFRFRSTISLATLLLKWLLSFLPVVLCLLYCTDSLSHYITGGTFGWHYYCCTLYHKVWLKWSALTFEPSFICWLSGWQLPLLWLS